MKKESQQNQRRWWIWPHDTASRSERTCLDCIRKSGENQIWKSERTSLNSWNVQQTSTRRPVLSASSSNYSEWNIDNKWSSQVWKSGEMSNTSTETSYDQFVIDDDMDSDAATESNLSRSQSFLNRVNDRLRRCWTVLQKMQCKTSTKVLWFDECLCLRHWIT